MALWLVGSVLLIVAVGALTPGLPGLDGFYRWPGRPGPKPELPEYPPLPLRSGIIILSGTVVGEVALLLMMLGTLVSGSPPAGETPFEAPSSPSPPSHRVQSPVPGYRINYPFGVRNKSYQAGYHTGADYAAPTGTQIVSVLDGVVVRTEGGGAYGTWTLIKCSDGRVWLYAHQSQRAVRWGDSVKAGQVIGYVGATGNAKGSHLHLEKSTGPEWAYGKVEKPTW
jgi:murein DD-endopeptidase MepM/ murein hydrolase activator NlpD